MSAGTAIETVDPGAGELAAAVYAFHTPPDPR
jgi:hypothetical protein